MSIMRRLSLGLPALAVTAVLTSTPAAAQAQKPNILVIMGDDVGWSNIGVYNQGIMSGRTPNLDRLANEGMRFTDYYAEASCTAGRANFITGELPIRTGLTTVGQARWSCTNLRSLGRSSIMGQKMMSSGFFLWCT